MKLHTKIIVFIALLLIVALGIYEMKKTYAPHETIGINPIVSVPVENTPTTSTYHGATFQFSYPQDMALDATPIDAWKIHTPHPGTVLASLTIARTTQPNTNFSEAWLSVSSNADTQAVQECLVGVNMEGPVTTTTTINGTEFKKFSFSEGAAGNYYATTSYHTIDNGACYVVEYTIHSTNIDNYDPSQGITAFNTQMVTTPFESIVNSFRFTN